MAKKSIKYIAPLLLALLIFGMMASTVNAGTSTTTAGNVTATLKENRSLISTSVKINITVNDLVNATSWYNITFPTDFNAAGANVTLRINGSANPVNWINTNGTLFVNVSSNDPTNHANKSTIQYINLSNITTPSTANTFTINITTNNSGVVIPLNYTTTTGSARAPVDLGTAGNFVILSKTGISTTGTTSIVGDIGVSPIAATAITGFDLIADASNVFSTSSLVTGDIYAANYAPPTPATMTTAISNMETAYTDAAGRTIPDVTELGAGDISGMTLYPGLYKWSSGVLITTGVTLDCQGNASAVFIFQIAQILTVANSASVTLSNGCQAKNIFWQVAGQTTLGTYSDFMGNILDQTLIEIQTGATLNGRALAQAAVTTDANAITVPNSPPTMSSTVPLNAAIGVANNSEMTATFSEAMNGSTVTNATFILNQGTTPVSGTVNYSGVIATFTPDSNLNASTVYTATITTGVKNLAGIALASNYTWTFTTGATPDTTAPTVNYTEPVNHSTGVANNSAISATFSEAMKTLTINTTTFILMNGSTVVSGNVTYSGVTAVLTPASNLNASTTYNATITTGVKDLAGNALASNYTWNFTASATSDTTKPTVNSTSPATAATGVATSSAMSAIFSEAMNPTTINTTTFTLKWGATPVSGTVTYSNRTAVFTPASNLAASTIYTAKITTGVKDLAGNALASNYTWNFTTGAIPDTTRPNVSSTIPLNNATGVSNNSAITATFSEALNASTVTNVTFTLKNGSTAVNGTVTYSGVTAVFTLLGNASYLVNNTNYTAKITTGVKDLAGNALAINYTWNFTAGATSDNTRPNVSSTTPANLSTGVVISSAMSAIFSEAMNPRRSLRQHLP